MLTIRVLTGTAWVTTSLLCAGELLVQIVTWRKTLGIYRALIDARMPMPGKMDFLIKFAQTHEEFRLPEIQALAILEAVDMTVLEYSQSVRRSYGNAARIYVADPFLVADMPGEAGLSRGSPEAHPPLHPGTIHPRALGPGPDA